MKSSKHLIVTVVVALVTGTSVLAAEDQITVGTTADFFSKYIWRGQNAVNDWVLQSSASIGYKGWTASVWGNLDLTGENGNRGEFSEVDLTLDHSGKIPGFEFLGYSAGLIYYDFPVAGGADDTVELYGGLSLDVPASPSMTVYQDVDEAQGTYISWGVGHSFANLFELAPGTPIALDLSASLGWGSGNYDKYYWGVDGSKLNDLVLSAALPFEIAGVTVTPSVHYVTLVSGDIRSANTYGNGSSDIWYAGISFAKQF
jgi:hypothetical protein